MFFSQSLQLLCRGQITVNKDMIDEVKTWSERLDLTRPMATFSGLTRSNAVFSGRFVAVNDDPYEYYVPGSRCFAVKWRSERLGLMRSMTVRTNTVL